MILWLLSCAQTSIEDTASIDPCTISLREDFFLREAECIGGICPVKEGVFIMGEGDSNTPDQCPPRDVLLSKFSIDETEVTQAQYTYCIEEGVCSPTPECPTQANIQNQSKVPQTCVTWFQAQEYCSWKGGSLPTEAQWEKSARGTTGASWPWGQTPPSCGVANFRYAPAYCTGGPVEVGSYSNINPLLSEIPTARTPFGLLDTVGNVWEWTLDWYDAGYFRYASDFDPQGPEECAVDLNSPMGSCTEKVLKGGAFNTLQDVTRGSSRGFLPPQYYDDNIGFRCAYR
jgi:sulfatase modifying factor 1